MESFPNYLTVEFNGKTYKVAPLRLNCATNRATLEAIGTSSILGSINSVMTSLETSLAENHSAQEVAEVIANLRYSASGDSPFAAFVLAMAGTQLSKPSADDE